MGTREVNSQTFKFHCVKILGDVHLPLPEVLAFLHWISRDADTSARTHVDKIIDHLIKHAPGKHDPP